MTDPGPDPTQLPMIRRRVQDVIGDLLDEQAVVLRELGDVSDLLDPIRALLRSGKRLRAAFAYWGYRAAGGPDSEALIRLATAMEFFQASALIHDDVMDGSDTRRGAPAAHRLVQARHAERGWVGDGERFGAGAAILAGNLCLNWSDELYATSGLPEGELARARGTFDRMRTQLMAGQYLDLAESVRDLRDRPADQHVEASRHVIRYKSAKYSIEHPLTIGAEAGGLSPNHVAVLAHYGLALGEAFQLRDDVLGVFGDPEVTGKPAGDDLREGKRTVLIGYAVAAGGPVAELIDQHLGDASLSASTVDAMRSALRDSGALAQTEALIERLVAEADGALRQLETVIPTDAYAALSGLVASATARDT